MTPLSVYEKIVLEMIEQAAERSRPCPSNLDIEMEIGANSSSIPPALIRSLEEKGLIHVTRYQRFREVTILATGLKTARCVSQRTSRPHVPRGARA
jgi:hypothetical protein